MPSLNGIPETYQLDHVENLPKKHKVKNWFFSDQQPEDRSAYDVLSGIYRDTMFQRFESLYPCERRTQRRKKDQGIWYRAGLHADTSCQRRKDRRL